MFEKLQKIIAIGEKLGANFVEARFEDLTLRSLHRTNDNWKDIISKNRKGVGITCYYQGGCGYSYTTSNNLSDIEKVVNQAFKIAKASIRATKLKLEFDKESPIVSINKSTFPVKQKSSDIPLEEKVDLINRAVESAREHGKNINNVRSLYGEIYGNKVFTNTEGSHIEWNFHVVDLVCSVTSKTTEGNLVSGSKRKGGTAGFEIFKNSIPETIGKKAGLVAKEQLEAKSCPAGQFSALVDNLLTGVLAHETFGHLSEADFVISGASPLGGKIGTKLGTEQATIIDNGTPDIAGIGGGIWVPFDDQGTKASETIILEKGIMSHFLHNRSTANHLKQKTTGNCRAVHFGFQPIPRMTNTYFTKGDLSEEEALESLNTGVYAIDAAGGQVDLDGSFLFQARRGYWVENGKKQYPLREVSLAGNILDLLGKVKGATKDFQLYGGYFGGCGKNGQFPLPTGLGGPKLIIDGVTFGGKA